MSLNDVFRDRFYGAGYIYIAGSMAGRVIKIGVTGALGGYDRYLQRRKYGGLNDWEVLYHFWVNDGAGRIEHEARALLQGRKRMKSYEKDGRIKKAREILRCGFSAAHEALLRAVADDERSQEWKSDRSGRYEFDRPVTRPTDANEQPIIQESTRFSTRYFQRVDELELSVRTSDCLKWENIIYVGDLVQRSEDQLLRVPNFGRKSVEEIRRLLETYGLRLGMEIPGWPPADIANISTRFQQMLLIKIDELELSIRTANCLKNLGIIYVGDLIQRSEAELLRTPSFGRRSVVELKTMLLEMGLQLGMDVF